MKILHIAPHLGGGVGKAHAALAAARRDPSGGAASQHRHSYVLLEQPRDTVYVGLLREAGCVLHVTPEAETLKALVADADIVQVEWWNHPRLYQVLAMTDWPRMRLVFWVHISSLAPPLVPGALLDLADKALFTSPCSLGADNLRASIQARPDAFGVINSGFVFPADPRPPGDAGASVRFGYLGTLDFAKMHPGFFDLVDGMDTDIRISLWGRLDPEGEVAERAASMRHPDRICFEGYAVEPARVLSSLDVFVYLLAPGHYGTGENALVEAMSLGAVPIVWNNPAERAIVKDRATGYVVRSEGEFAARLALLAGDADRLRRLSAAAREDVALQRTPQASLRALDAVYARVAEEPKRSRDFAAALGRTSRDWFLSSLPSRDAALASGDRLLSASTSKGSLGHFRECLGGDQSLAAFVPA
jgi:glycosyltransferase involved in cell wall biosynthesis